MRMGKSDGIKGVEAPEMEVVYRNWLYHVPGIGKAKLASVREIYGSAQELCKLSKKEREDRLSVFREKKTKERLSASECIRKPGDNGMEGREGRSDVKRASRGGLNIGDLKRIEEFGKEWTPEGLWEDLGSRGIHILTPEMEEYPRRLKSIADRPELLYCLEGESENGNSGEDKRPAVAVVGSRICSEYGKMVAKRIGRLCAEMGMELVSGMAVGIDGISQQSAWEAGGMVSAVLGSGVNVCYPNENEELYVNLTKRGRIFSELPVGTRPVAGNFPARNRIISGLSDALIVVEAREKSGTMITVDMALEQGRQVYIIPGRLSDPLSAGCNRLIAQGAEIVWNLSETMERILSEFSDGNTSCMTSTADGDGNQEESSHVNYSYVNQCSLDSHNPSVKNDNYVNYQADDPEACIFAALDYYPQSVQQIYEKLAGERRMTLAALQTKLVEMELMGRIKEEGGRFFRKGE